MRHATIYKSRHVKFQTTPQEATRQQQEQQVATPIYVNRLELIINKLLIKTNEFFWLLFKLLFKLLFELLFKLLFELSLKL